MTRRDVRIRPAEPGDAEGVARVCAAGWRDTYAGLMAPERIETVIAEYYTPERICREIGPADEWDGWIVAVEDADVVGAGAGGMTAPAIGELFVLYLHPRRRGEGIGTRLVETITEQQRIQGAREQWVSVEPGNDKALPFYRARGFEVRGTRPEWGTAPEAGRLSLRLMRRLG